MRVNPARAIDILCMLISRIDFVWDTLKCNAVPLYLLYDLHCSALCCEYELLSRKYLERRPKARPKLFRKPSLIGAAAKQIGAFQALVFLHIQIHMHYILDNQEIQ